MKLFELLKHFPELVVYNPQKLNPNITNITCHSQKVAPGSLFVAKRGAKEDGNRYSIDAVNRGAVVVLTEIINPELNAVQLKSTNILEAEGKLAHVLYGKPSDTMLMVGVTGTSGKTTTAYAIRHIFEMAKIHSGLIGTVEYIVGGVRIPAERTTPDAPTTHQLLYDMAKAGAKAGVMEVSSHALCQGRVEGIEFDIAAFTNLTHEHLDYHKSMEEYCDAKNLLIRSLVPKELAAKPHKPKCAVVNSDSPWLSRFLEGLRVDKLTYSILAQADLQAKNIAFSKQKTTFELHYKNRKYSVEIPLVGLFNVENMLAAIGVTLASGLSLDVIIAACKTFKGPPGRLERVENSKGLQIYIDYAHKEDALKNVLQTLRPCTKGKLIVVFGCGGDRDREKRPRMGQIAESLADLVILTSDNPRSEEPQAIIEEIKKGFKDFQKQYDILDRKEAIAFALSKATAEDIVLIAGKGHEKKQEFFDRVIPFDDVLVAYEATL